MSIFNDFEKEFNQKKKKESDQVLEAVAKRESDLQQLDRLLIESNIHGKIDEAINWYNSKCVQSNSGHGQLTIHEEIHDLSDYNLYAITIRPEYYKKSKWAIHLTCKIDHNDSLLLVSYREIINTDEFVEGEPLEGFSDGTADDVIEKLKDTFIAFASSMANAKHPVLPSLRGLQIVRNTK